MQNVCKKILFLLVLTSLTALHADPAVTSIEQLEEKMENVTLCSDSKKESCTRFLETPFQNTIFTFSKFFPMSYLKEFMERPRIFTSTVIYQ